MKFRIIPRLDIKGPNLVKGINLEGLRALGPPDYFARYYYENGADELLFMDAVASLYGRNSLIDIVERTSSEIFIPLCVGGGLRTIDDMRTALRSGADKVSINTAAIECSDIIREAANMFGSSTIVVSIEAAKRNGGYECFIDNGREPTGREPLEWARQAVDLGAGELIITSIEQEGTGRGYDVDLVQSIATAVPVPVIACGGAGTAAHVGDVIHDGRADAVSMASLLHYHVIEHEGVPLAEEYGIGQIADRRNPGARINPISLPGLKAFLSEREIEVRSVAQ